MSAVNQIPLIQIGTKTVIVFLAINVLALVILFNSLFGFYDLTSYIPHKTATESNSKIKKAPPPISQQNSQYPLHSHILATMFWIGEKKLDISEYVPRVASEWDDFWLQHYGGIDTPYARNGYYPDSFIPKENPFYIALPYDDLTDTGRKQSSLGIPWYSAFDTPYQSILKNKWIKVTYQDNTCYGQWEDVGPNATDDLGYVFGTTQPQQTAGIDLSPAMRNCLKMADNDYVDWQFIDKENVPSGPWKDIITYTPTNYAGSATGVNVQ